MTWNVSVMPDFTPYDLSQYGVVNFADLDIVRQHFSEITSAPYPRYDVNNDEKVDILDLIDVSKNIN